MIIDTHAHYDDEAFDEDREEIIHRLKEEGIELVVNVGASMQTSRNTVSLTRQYDFFYGAVGVHPNEVLELDEEKIEKLREYARLDKIVAIGEIGLDYHWDEPEREKQKYWFERQLDLAKEEKMPIIIHSREAAKDTLDILGSQEYSSLSGVIHCFSYGVDMAREYLNRDYYLGIGGVVTFNNAKKLKEVVSYTPMDRIVLETDCPYLSPVPNRGKRNSSLNLSYVIGEIATIKNMQESEVIRITNQNAKRLYRL